MWWPRHHSSGQYRRIGVFDQIFRLDAQAGSCACLPRIPGKVAPRSGCSRREAKQDWPSALPMALVIAGGTYADFVSLRTHN